MINLEVFRLLYDVIILISNSTKIPQTLSKINKLGWRNDFVMNVSIRKRLYE